MIVHKFAKANNPYLTDFDPKKPKSYLMYLDAKQLVRLGNESKNALWSL